MQESDNEKKDVFSYDRWMKSIIDNASSDFPSMATEYIDDMEEINNFDTLDLYDFLYDPIEELLVECINKVLAKYGTEEVLAAFYHVRSNNSNATSDVINAVNLLWDNLSDDNIWEEIVDKNKDAIKQLVNERIQDLSDIEETNEYLKNLR